MARFRKMAIRFAKSSMAMLAAWLVALLTLSPPAYLLPSPLRVLREIVSRGGFYTYHALNTIVTSLSGLALGVVVGVLLAFVSVLYSRWGTFIEASAVTLRTLPIVAIAPIIILWFGTGRLSQVVIVGLICFFPIYSGVLRGMQRAELSRIRLFRLYSASRAQVFLHLRVPNAVPFFLDAFPLTVTLAVLGALVAEFTGYDKGLGSLVLRGLYRLDAPMLFAANVLAAAIGVVLYLLSFLLEIPFEKYVRGREINEGNGGRDAI